MFPSAPLIRPLGLTLALSLCAPALAAETGAPSGSETGTEAPNAPLRIALPAGPQPPSGIEARAYTEDGIAPAFARDLAKALGRGLQPVPPTGAQLRLGRGDGSGTETGYRSGLSVAMRTDTDIHSWAQIKGRTVCFTETNSAARHLVLEHGAIAVPQRAPALSLVKVRTGECDAALHEAALLDQLFALPDWQKFSASLPVLDVQPLVLHSPQAALPTQISEALVKVGSDKAWQIRTEKWARNVAFEVWLEQDAPDCH